MTAGGAMLHLVLYLNNKPQDFTEPARRSNTGDRRLAYGHLAWPMTDLARFDEWF
jgi:hypothetical protein